MKRLLGLACALAAPAMLSSSCTTAPARPTGGLTHVVVFWLKDPGNAAHRATVIQTSLALRNIPGVLSVEAGPCLPSARPIVDSTFDVAATMRFAGAAELQRYLDNPQHRESTLRILKPLVRKITVYDFAHSNEPSQP